VGDGFGSVGEPAGLQARRRHDRRPAAGRRPAHRARAPARRALRAPGSPVARGPWASRASAPASPGSRSWQRPTDRRLSRSPVVPTFEIIATIATPGAGPGTVLRWHRHLAARKWANPSREGEVASSYAETRSARTGAGWCSGQLLQCATAVMMFQQVPGHLLQQGDPCAEHRNPPTARTGALPRGCSPMGVHSSIALASLARTAWTSSISDSTAARSLTDCLPWTCSVTSTMARPPGGPCPEDGRR
jgi:hypothetical protein